MENFKIQETNEYQRLVKFFIENQLEFTEAEPVPTDLVKCWGIFGESDQVIGGVVLAKRDGEFIIDGIAVDEKYRKKNLGEELLAVAIAEVKLLGGSEIYLVARAPGFFRRFGFEAIDGDKAPNFFECLTCPQFGKECNPEIMARREEII